MAQDQEERKVSRYELGALIPAAFPRVWICDRRKESMSFTGLENSKQNLRDACNGKKECGYGHIKDVYMIQDEKTRIKDYDKSGAVKVAKQKLSQCSLSLQLIN